MAQQPSNQQVRPGRDVETEREQNRPEKDMPTSPDQRPDSGFDKKSPSTVKSDIE